MVLPSSTWRRQKPADALVIGGGGGLDIVWARAMGADQITGVEINPATIDLVTRIYRSWVDWPNWRNIDVVCAEGRHFCKSTPHQYDTIVMSGIDTFSAL